MLAFKIKCVCGYEFDISVGENSVPDSAVNKIVAIVEKTQKDHLDCVKVARSSPEKCKACGGVLEIGCVNSNCNACLCRVE